MGISVSNPTGINGLVQWEESNKGLCARLVTALLSPFVRPSTSMSNRLSAAPERLTFECESLAWLGWVRLLHLTWDWGLPLGGGMSRGTLNLLSSI